MTFSLTDITSNTVDESPVEKHKLFKGRVPQWLDKCFIAGGALTSHFTKQPINDWDIYPKSQEACDDIVREFFNEGFCVHMSSRAITFLSRYIEDEKYQVMLFDTFPTAQSIYDRFDFTINMAAYDCDSQKIDMHPEFLTDLASRSLKFNTSTLFPYTSLQRVMKYKERGFGITQPQLFSVLMACQNMPLKSWDDLKTQMGGIYGELLEVPDDTPYSFEAALEAIHTFKEGKILADAPTSYTQAAVRYRKDPFVVIAGLGDTKQHAICIDDEWDYTTIIPDTAFVMNIVDVAPKLYYFSAKPVEVQTKYVNTSHYNRMFTRLQDAVPNYKAEGVIVELDHTECTVPDGVYWSVSQGKLMVSINSGAVQRLHDVSGGTLVVRG